MKYMNIKRCLDSCTSGDYRALQVNVLICISGNSDQLQLIQEGYQCITKLKTRAVAVHIFNNTDRISSGELSRDIIAECERLDIPLLKIAGDNIPNELLKIADELGVDRLLMGGREDGTIGETVRCVLSRMTDMYTGFTVEVISSEDKISSSLTMSKMRYTLRLSGLIQPLLITAFSTVLALLLRGVFDTSNILIVFFLAVVCSSLLYGRIIAYATTVCCVLSFDFFFVEPLQSFSVSDLQYLFTFILMLCVAILVSTVARRMSKAMKLSRKEKVKMKVLGRIVAELAMVDDTEKINSLLQKLMSARLKSQIHLFLPQKISDSVSREQIFSSSHDIEFTNHIDTFQDVFCNAEKKRRRIYMSLRFPSEGRAVLLVIPKSARHYNDYEDEQFTTTCCFAIALALSRLYYSGAVQRMNVEMETEKLRNTFLSAVSHDLKNHLTIIRGMTETLEDPAVVEPRQRAYLVSTIKNQTRVLELQVTNLLDSIKMQNSAALLDKQWHSLSDVIGASITHVADIIYPRKINVTIPPDFPFVEIDAALMLRVFTNLFVNCAKYTSVEASITILVQLDAGGVYIIFKDDGPGFPKEIKPDELFQPFIQGADARAGVGLGLSLCRCIIDAHGGSISPLAGEMKGACIEIRLPQGIPPVMESEYNA
ncbi:MULTISPECIES: DUF4118 domain-containing protein [Enterobacteriaceae]|nr:MULTISPECIES: DUF4118 domain-containing protein [Enterobacteriaceae]EBY8737981.1 DUF4118 domain-containing protein [Salmonella enterica subsp. enterica serovar Grumpensis]ECS2971935.1 DUF4118 domain-containing protein [Salmonella enterica subsp. enterica serovar Bredeney]EGF6384880.1 DUF4118 domain-containing protein [Salmonella enterica subsp. enterica serovar Cubana]MDA6776177.1 DUF4118 domain-containing protein [Escherichia coli]MLA27528.1 DUF4118 domain-containing protein [Salmonella en